MFRMRKKRSPKRRGSIIVLSTVMLIVMIALVAFAVDLGYILLVKTQLQVAVDSAAMAAAASMGQSSGAVVTAAQDFAGRHVAGGTSVAVSSSDVEMGTWDATTRAFVPSASNGNAVRVTARRNDQTRGNNLFWARALGMQTFTTQASAIAMGNPRDIVFVVDLSGSMNDDTEPCWATSLITAEFGPLGYPTVGSDMIQTLYTQFGYGTYPGTLQWIGAPKGVTADNRAYANLTKNSGPLTLSSIASTYKILSSDSEATRKTKGYRWIIDYQIATVMPAARPTPNSSTNYAYWEKYLDYVIANVTVNSGSGASPSNRGALPPSQDTDRIDGLNNPNNVSYPSATSSLPQGFRNQIGYRTYLQFCLDNGRNKRPDGTNYSPLSTSSPYCPWHSESTAGGTFSFPPSEQPTHAARRSLIAAINEIKLKNNSIPDVSQRDWVSVVTFDTVSGATLCQSLTGNYDTAMQSCTRMQAVADDVYSTATETGLILGQSHISSPASGGVGRYNTQKIVVLLTDGMPNLYSSSNSTISAYRNANPNSDFYGGSNYAYDAPLMQTLTMQLNHWKVFPVGLGLGTDYTFMDRVARMGYTANDSGQSSRTSSNPVDYETALSDIFRNIITNPQVRLVK